MPLVAVPSLARAQDATPVLPDGWLGEWRGEMTAFMPGGQVQPVPVSLTIRPLEDGSYEWRTVYDDDPETGLRDYRLVPVPGSSGDFVLDEQNGIRLQVRVLGGTLVTPFSIGGQTLVSRYSLTEDELLIHEIFFWPAEPELVTTGTGPGAEGGTEVRSYPASGIQRTLLRKTG